jgi:hypothetical protein
MNAQIRVLPTRAIEYIVMDFVVLPSGVSIWTKQYIYIILIP